MILRDVAEKIITWLQKFKGIGDVAANFDPAHVALPWAGVRFLLQTIVADSEQMGALLVGVDSMTNFINRCKIYEMLYLDDGQAGQARSNLELALVELYTTILQFLASTSMLYDNSTGVRALRAFLEPSKLTDFIEKCGVLQARADVEANNCDHTHTRVAHTRVADLERLLGELAAPIVRTDLQVRKLWDRLEDSRRTRILTWASNVPFEDNHYAAREGHVSHTGDWLLDDERYREWRRSSASMILWLHGIPGAGKTKLVSTVVESLRTTLQNAENDESLAYFYYDRNQSDRQKPAMVLSSFVRQLSTSRNWHGIQPSLTWLYTEKEAKGFASNEMNIEESESVLLELVNIFPQTTIVLDALDECDRRTRGRLIEVFDRLLLNSSKPIKIFISSRPDQDIKDRFDSGPNVGIQATDDQGDISTFLDDKIEKSPERWQKKISDDLRNDILETLVDESEGMFQWASLQIDQLLDLPPIERVIRGRLGKLPKDLEKAYDEIYANIMAQDERVAQIANRAFRWVSCSCKPLSTAELVDAVCQDPETDAVDSVDDMDMDAILSACHNLLVVNLQLNECRFSHLSVQEYFETHHWGSSEVSGELAKVCLSLLVDSARDDCNRYSTIGAECNRREEERVGIELESGLGSGREWTDLESLVCYAISYWPIHVQRHGEINVDARLVTLLKQFLGSLTRSGLAYRKWYTMTKILVQRNINYSETARQYRLSGLLAPSSKTIFAVCAFALHQILPDWWAASNFNIEERDDRGKSLLQVAVAGGSISMVEELLLKGVNVNGHGLHCGGALLDASAAGHDAVVKLLLKAGADVNAQDGYEGSALHAASYTGQFSTVSLILEARANVNAQGGIFGNALQAACFRGDGSIVQQLLEAGAKTNAEGGSYGTALQASLISQDTKSTLNLLLTAGANINAQCGVYGNPLQAASLNCQPITVQQLLEIGANVNAQGGAYGNALQAACLAQDSSKTVILLLHAGADVNAQGGQYGNALQAASATGNYTTVKLLLEAGADLDAEGPYGSALEAAAFRGKDATAKLLLETGAGLNSQEEPYSSAIVLACSTGQISTMKLLREARTKLNERRLAVGTQVQS